MGLLCEHCSTTTPTTTRPRRGRQTARSWRLSRIAPSVGRASGPAFLARSLSTQRRVWHPLRQVGDVFDVDPVWSPDGAHLAVSSTSWPGGLLRLIDVRTGVGVALENSVIGRHPSWLNNTVIVYQTYDIDLSFQVLSRDIVTGYTSSLYNGAYFPLARPAAYQPVRVVFNAVEMFYERLTPNNGVMVVFDDPIDPAITMPIPHKYVIHFTITIYNDTSEAIESGQLRLALRPAGSSPDPDDSTAIHHSGGYTDLDPLYPVRISFNDNISIPFGESVTLEGGGNEGRGLLIRPTRSGNNSVNFRFTYGDLGQSYEDFTDLVVATTNLNFEGEDLGLKAAMFWAMFNENSEGNILLHDPENFQSCFQQGWTVPYATSISWVIRRAEDSNSFPRCRNLLYMDAQTMLNGMLNYERNYRSAYSPVGYFTENFKGSIGNQPSEDSEMYYQGDVGDPYNGSSVLWMDFAFWPLGSAFGITDIHYPEGSKFPADRIGYRVVFDPNQTIAELPGDFDREKAVLRWLNMYLENWMANTPVDARDAWQRSFYQDVYLNPTSVINTVDLGLQK